MRIVAIKRFVEGLMVHRYQKTYLTRPAQEKAIKVATKSIKHHPDPLKERLRWERVFTKVQTEGHLGEPAWVSVKKGKPVHHDVVMNVGGRLRDATETFEQSLKEAAARRNK